MGRKAAENMLKALALNEVFSRPTYRADYARAKAQHICVLCGRSVTSSRFLKRVNPEVKFIVLGVHDDPVAARERLAAGAKGFVLKRTAVNDLVPAVEGVLRGEVYVSPRYRNQLRPSKPKDKAGEESE
jgi:DNA-binding NarL/FixJ family response regulator